MDSKRLHIPPLSRPKRFGQPYHGLLVNGTLTLSTGATIDWPGAPYGDVYRFKVPGAVLEMDPTEVAIEAALGREWRSVALLTGHMRNYAGIVVGSNAWLYGAPDGTVWRIECLQLDSPIAAIEPALGRGRPWPFPETLDFTFKIRRFGVVSPDSPLGSDAPTTTRVVEGQSLGGAWMSDYVPLDGTNMLYNRRNLWQADLPWMPINIEDVSSTGARAIFAVNRSVEQSALEGQSGRASPYAWLLVTVTGDEQSGVDVSMAVEEVEVFSPTSSYLGSDVVYAGEWWVRNPDGSVTSGPPPSWYTEGNPQTYTTTGAQNARTVGLYFDESDVVRRVRTSGVTGTQVESGSQRINSAGATDYYRWVLSVEISAVGVAFESGAAVSFPAISAQAERSITGGSMSVIGSVLGPISSALEQDWWVSASMYAGVSSSTWAKLGSVVPSYGPGMDLTSSWWLKGAVALRGFDGLAVARVTNKVYAVFAFRETRNDIHPPIPGVFKVLAIGSPAGWVTGSAIEQHWKSSWNPITGQLATCEAGQSRGWV